MTKPAPHDDDPSTWEPLDLAERNVIVSRKAADAALQRYRDLSERAPAHTRERLREEARRAKRTARRWDKACQILLADAKFVADAE